MTPELAELVAATNDLIIYCEQILTGPMAAAAGVTWPDGVPNGPVLRRARAAVDALK